METIKNADLPSALQRKSTGEKIKTKAEAIKQTETAILNEVKSLATGTQISMIGLSKLGNELVELERGKWDDFINGYNEVAPVTNKKKRKH